MTRSQFTNALGIIRLFPSSACTTVMVLIIQSGLLAQPKIWINEFHYDNAEGDVDEFVEVVAPESFANRDKVSLTLYNGSKGEPYGSAHTLDTFTQGAKVDSFRIYYKTITGLQNGSPDGFCLDYEGTVLHFISYEGSFEATKGPAQGLKSEDVSVEEVGTTEAGNSLQLIGSGFDIKKLSWTGPVTATKGATNVNQPLPVELTSFSAAIGADGVELEWKTASEINNFGYFICRSENEQHGYQVISGFISGKGATTTLQKYRYSDRVIDPVKRYFYKLKQMDLDGSINYHGPISICASSTSTNLPMEYRIIGAYPNPFNPGTKIRFKIGDRGGTVRISIYNLRGQILKTLVQGEFSSGSHEVHWYGDDNRGNPAPNGVYFCVLKWGQMKSRSLKLLKLN